MKKRIALLLAFLMIFGVLPLSAQAAPAETTVVSRVFPFQLSDVQAQVLPLLEAAIRARQETLDLSEYRITASELLDLLNALKRDPEFFYFDTASAYFDPYTEEVAYAELEYNEDYGDGEIAALEAAVQKALNAVLPGMSDLQKALALHDYLTLHIAYDSDNLQAGTVPEDSYNVYGALVKGVAVCEGYAKAYQLLLGRCGIDAVMVSSLDMNHGWNLVKLEDSWYHVDVTWDDPTPDTPGKADHAYFLLSDEAIRSRDTGSGSLHYGWDGEIVCADTRYDGDTLWSGCTQPLVFSDASTLWLLRSAGEGREQVLTLIRRDWAGGEETAVYNTRDYWPVWEKPGSYWVDAYSGLCRWGGMIFYNDSLHIYGCDPAGGSLQTVLTYGGGDGYIYGLSAADDGLRYLVSKSPDEPGAVLSFVPSVPEPAPEPTPLPGGVYPFADVVPSDYYYEAVLWAYENNVTKGTSGTEFSPAASCTRGQVVTFLWRAAGEPEPASSENPFADVKEGDYFCKAVLWAVEKGVTNGAGMDEATGKQLFSPGQTCSYAHILTFLYRAATGNLTSAGAYYDDALRWARENGLLEGTLVGRDQGRINADCPRCDVVTYLWRRAA